ncbi:hypothetical protein GCM10025868_28400 [Angustibacter aerolatus]|uniref:Secreted protein n=1 Tax=Angustibacter aerolatus TaxID=1162965 RepID=A0ABQ6JK14_9ACTN|nr:hypothetical protein GCM10025868_28400 [Angustibacter aerolatus]
MVSFAWCWSTTSARTGRTSTFTYDAFQPFGSRNVGNSESSARTATDVRPWAFTFAAVCFASEVRSAPDSVGSPAPTSTTLLQVLPRRTVVVKRWSAP